MKRSGVSGSAMESFTLIPSLRHLSSDEFCFSLPRRTGSMQVAFEAVFAADLIQVSQRGLPTDFDGSSVNRNGSGRGEKLEGVLIENSGHHSPTKTASSFLGGTRKIKGISIFFSLVAL